jgi:predicted transglutaminase-like cysteine proteinase
MGAGLRHGIAAAATALGCTVLLLVSTPAPALDAERLRGAAAALGSRAEAGARELLALVQRLAPADEVAKAREVNEFYNARIRYDSDLAIWNQPEYWASPLQTLDKGRGDCEDFVIAKYFTLVAAGVPHTKLRMAYVAISVPPAAPERPGETSVAHMVLAYYAQPTAEPLILDNVVREVRPASQRPDLSPPTYVFNAEGTWRTQAGQDRRLGDANKMARWPDLASRVLAEGF